MENKFKVGDKVWVMNNNKPEEKEILAVIEMFVSDEDKSKKIKYSTSWDYGFRLQKIPSLWSQHLLEEQHLFKTKQELLESL